jgi:hypothetical protein
VLFVVRITRCLGLALIESWKRCPNLNIYTVCCEGFALVATPLGLKPGTVSFAMHAARGVWGQSNYAKAGLINGGAADSHADAGQASNRLVLVRRQTTSAALWWWEALQAARAQERKSARAQGVLSRARQAEKRVSENRASEH